MSDGTYTFTAYTSEGEFGECEGEISTNGLSHQDVQFLVDLSKYFGGTIDDNPKNLAGYEADPDDVLAAITECMKNHPNANQMHAMFEERPTRSARLITGLISIYFGSPRDPARVGIRNYYRNVNFYQVLYYPTEVVNVTHEFQ